MDEEQDRGAYWKIVFAIREYIEESGRSRDDIFEEFYEDIA